MGSVPPWYPLVSAARWLGVNPWDLDEQSVVWIHRAHAAALAEEHAQEMAIKMNKS